MSDRAAADARVVRRWIQATRPGRDAGLSRPSATFTAPDGLAGFTDDTGWSDELPGTSLEVVIELDGTWDLSIDGHHSQARSFAAGLVAGRVRTRSDGPIRLVQLSVDPLAAPALFGVPAGQLGGAAFGLDAVLGRDAPRLLERIDASMACGESSVEPGDLSAEPGDSPVESGDASRRPQVGSTEPTRPSGDRGGIHVAETWVSDRVRRAEAERGPLVPADVRRACDLMRASGGALRAQAVADELGCSRRHLTRRFDEFVGVGPSQFTRLIRFERATNALRRDPSQPLGGLALDCNYADHAHMDREFAALAGAPPSVVAARFVGGTPTGRVDSSDAQDRSRLSP